MASQVQLANTFNDFRLAYNDAANDVTALVASNTDIQSRVNSLENANSSIRSTGTGNIYANTVQVTELNSSAGRVVITRAPGTGSGAVITDDAELRYVTANNGLITSNTTVDNQLTVSSLTQGRLVFSGASGLLSDDAELRYVTANNALLAANVTIDSLSPTYVAFAGAGGLLSTDAGLQFHSGNNNLIVDGQLDVATAMNSQSVSAATSVTAQTWANAANIFVSANVNVTDTVNALGHLHAGGVEAWITAKGEDRDIHLIAAVDDSDGPHDIAIVNRNNNANAYGEFIAMNNSGNTEQGWVSMGINATNYNQGAFAITKGDDAYILYQAPSGTTKEGDLIIGTGGNGTKNRIIFSADGFDDPANNTQIVITPGNNVHIEIDTESTSTSTGALTINGGLGLVGNMNVGGNVAITGTITLTGSGNTVSTDSLAVANAILFLANGSTTDSLDVGLVGQYNQGGDKYFGFVRDQSDNNIKIFQDLATRPANTTNFASVNYANTRVGVLHASNTAAASNPSTGALIVGGGAGINGGIWAGGSIRTDSTTASTSTSTGALIINGGAGIAGNTNIGGILKTNDSTASTSTSTGALIVGGGAGIAGDMYVGGEARFGPATSDVGSGNAGISWANTAGTFVSRNTDHLGARSNVIRLMRDGTSGQIYSGAADFDISRWESSSVSPRVELTLKLGHGDPSGDDVANAWRDVMVWRSSGTIICNTAVDSTSTTTGSLVVKGGAGIAGNTHIGGDLNVTGSIIANEIVEGVTDVAVSTNTYNCDYNNGNIFYATSAPSSGDFTLALTNVPTTNGRVTNITLILPQGATARRPSGNAISINGTSTLVNFVGGNTSFTPTASKTDIFNFTILRRSNAFTVAGTVTANTVL